MSETIRFGGTGRGGMTLEEIWLMNAIILKGADIFIINNQQPPQPIDNVGRKELVSAHEIIVALKSILPVLLKHPSDKHMDERGQYDPPHQMLVYDGATVAHAVSLVGADRGTGFFVYHDSWGGRSLLCKENNDRDVSAIHHPVYKEFWMVNPSELINIIHTVILPYQLWQNVKEN